ncbi:alpha/beta hydrolase [Enteractinococcus helveticum]|uniref:Serine aminopeptidase S33 domain-containing protein n=1 Tax=Enteractinococcus helveticum TaxID=1837282 RepID=A0A1B7M127_9MICC|nr:alpha/beta fold hydrolase [Enteractinococcus helveticum]OAV62131.1 hypothetical protein A6F49_07510 [Enteractinococcus helveticum]
MEPQTDFQTEERTFISEGVVCAATLYRPAMIDGPVPCVVLAASLNQTRMDGYPRFAERFAAAGYAALVFDYRYVGDSEGEPRQLVDYQQQREDLRAAVEFARTLDGVDPAQIILWGFSFGGGHAISVGAEDQRLAAVLTLCPFLDGLVFSATSGIGNSLRRMAAAAKASWVREPIRMLVTAPPRQLALFNQPEAVAGFEAMRSENSLWFNEILVKPTQPQVRIRPIRHAKEISCPLWVGLATRDTMVPAAPIRRLAQQAPNAELRTFESGHFDGFVGHFDEIIKSQLAFLRRALAHA